MPLRVLHVVAFQETWYGRWGYSFGRGGFHITKTAWRKAASLINRAPISAISRDFRGVDDAVVKILDRYRVS